MRLTIRSRLLLAFGATTLLTIAAAGVGIRSFSQTSAAFDKVIDTDMMTVARASDLALTANAIAAAAPSLAAAQTPEDLADVRSRLAPQIQSLRQTINGLGEVLPSEEWIDLDSRVTSIEARLLVVEEARQADLELDREITAKMETLELTLFEMAQQTSPIMRGVNFAMELVFDEVAAGTISKDGASKSDLLLFQRVSVLQRDIEKLRSLANQAVGAKDGERATTVRSAVSQAMTVVRRTLEEMGDAATSAGLIESIQTIEDGLQGKDGVLDLVDRSLSQDTAIAKALKEAQDQVGGLTALVTTITGKLKEQMSAAVSDTRNGIQQAEWWLTGLGIASVLIAVVMITVVVHFGIVRRIRRLVAAMNEVRDGRLDTAIPTGGKDEIAEMADALLVFRDTARAVEDAKAEAEQQRQAAAVARSAEMRSLADRFEASVKGVVVAVSNAAEGMRMTAQSMAGVAQEASSESASVAASAEQATMNVQTVATSAEQLTASIGEIGQQVARSTQIAERAVGEAERTNQTVENLSKAAARIGDVVKLITEIAGQTNLLALNATIEAARAGDAGKGFAVVAQEVKALASQTARATEDIAAQIGAIQMTSSEAVSAIAHIGGTIREISEIATTIAAAIEEQGAATNEIARNVQQAAQGTQQVSETIVRVNAAAGEAGRAASDVLEAAGVMASESTRLRDEVENFLNAVRAA